MTATIRELESETAKHCVSPRVQIQALGRFVVTVDGQPLVPATRKVALLLKAIVALGPQPVAQERVAEALWPDTSGPSARGAFDTTLHRLRRWLQVPDAVRLVDGHVQLNTALCWVDAYVLCQSDAETLVATYQGKLLPDCCYEAWVDPLRDALHLRYLRAAAACGLERERQGCWHSALALYERALEHDDLSEPLHQGVIRCQLALGHRAEALRAYERCERRLMQAFSASPHAGTQALADRARGEAVARIRGA